MPDELDRQAVRWYRTAWGEGDLENVPIVLLVEVSGEGVVVRQVELAGPDEVPVAVGSAEEWWEARGPVQQATTSGRMGYERRLGRAGEGNLHEWVSEYPGEAITANEFERTWTAARQHLIAPIAENSSSNRGSNRYFLTRRSVGRGSGS